MADDNAKTIPGEEFGPMIDPRIERSCIACPPDPHPEEFYCGWTFTMAEE